MTATALPVWPVARIEEALGLLTGESIAQTFPAFADSIQSQRDLEPWLYAASAARNLEVEPLRVRNSELEQAVAGAAPALLVVQDGVLAVRYMTRRRLVLLRPEGGEKTLPIDAVCTAIRLLWERRYSLPTTEVLLTAAGVPAARRVCVRAELLRQQLASRAIDAGWTVRLAPSAPVLKQLRHSGQVASTVKMAIAFVANYGSTLLAWYLIGRTALAGDLDQGWDVAWALALLTSVVFRAFTSFWQGTVSIGFGALFKRRLLLGALRLERSETQRDGVGRFLSRVLDSESVEELVLSGGFASALSLIEFCAAMFVLGAASGARLAVGLMLGVTLAIGLIALAEYRQLRRWTSKRLQLTHDLIERLVGHRTRMAQEDPLHWHDDEDRMLDDYQNESRRMDRLIVTCGNLLPRGFFIMALVALGPVLLTGRSPNRLAVSLGALILALRALYRLGSGSTALMEAAIAWRNAGKIFRAAGVTEAVATATGLAAGARPLARGESVLEAHALTFSHQAHREVLQDVDLRIHLGDQILIEGNSGSGKSTLVSILAGLVLPRSGLLLLGGFDRYTLGAAVWRRRIATAPQFHENHIMHGTLAYNLLMGREWPPENDDLIEAETICRELGLSYLLDRMPNGLSQLVGDSGWRLSHGEQSRVYIARALLQKSDVVVLDESFAALDPDSLQLVMQCVRRRAQTLVVVAHP